MKQCTLFCRLDDPSRVIAVTNKHISGDPKIAGAAGDWKSLTVKSDGHKIRLVRTREVSPGDKLSRILLGMVNWLQRVATPNRRATPVAVRRVLKTTALIGITGTPQLSEEQGHFDYIFALAVSLDALVWNGNALLTPEGDLLVNDEGETEL